MIEPISCNCGAKYSLNFKGGENNNNNFKGITSSLPEAPKLSVRDSYDQAVKSADETQKDFTAPKGVAENLNIVA